MDTYEFTKYITDKEHLRDTVKMYGVAIIPSVLNEEECQNLVDGLWNYFETITQQWNQPIQRNDESTWNQIYSLFPLHSMLFQHLQSGHTQCCWDVRQNPKLVDIFSHFWNCKNEDLLVSFDGFSFNLPPEITKKGWNNNNVIYHTDQSYRRHGFETIQSWITGLDVNEGDATLSFMEQSHLYHRECAEYFQIGEKNDWYQLSKEQEQFYMEKGCQYKKIKCPKGSLVVWDSRTVHCGTNAFKERQQPNMRAIIYVCYLPRSFITKTNLEKKRKYYKDLRNTTHHPCKIKVFSKIPRTYGKQIETITSIETPILSKLGLKLAGF